MEFWGVEVKAGEPFEVKPEPGQLVHISQAALGETTAKDLKGARSIPLRLVIDDKHFVLGSLKPEERTQISFDLVFEKKFVLTHDWKNGSVFFAGYLADDPVSDSEYTSDEYSSSDSEDELEKDSPAPAPAPANGAAKPAKGAAAVAKSDSKKKKDTPVVESSEEEDSEDGSDEGMEPSLGGDSSDEGLQSLGDDSEEDESEEEEELPKVKVQQPKKRPAESAAPVNAKKAKAKAVTPEKTSGNKKGQNAAPSKASAGNKSKQSPKSGGSGGAGKKGKRGNK